MRRQVVTYAPYWVLALSLPALFLLWFAGFIGLDEDLTRSSFYACIAVLAPIFLAGLASSYAPRSPSFSAARPGLRVGFRVKARLRVVEVFGSLIEITSTFVALGAVYASMPIWLRLVGELPLSGLVFTAVVVIVFLASLSIVRYALFAMASLAFRMLRLMDAQEAAHFPLQGWRRHPVYGRRLRPWPDSWQEPIETEGNGEQQHGR
jgi:hypothetical protein